MCQSRGTRQGVPASGATEIKLASSPKNPDVRMCPDQFDSDMSNPTPPFLVGQLGAAPPLKMSSERSAPAWFPAMTGLISGCILEVQNVANGEWLDAGFLS